MIRSIYPSGKYMQVTGGSPMSPTIYASYQGAQSPNGQSFIGQVRYNTSSQNLEIFDGNIWQTLYNSSASVALSPEAESILDWAKEKIREEVRLKELMAKHPGLKDAYDRFEVMKALVNEEN